VSNQAGISRGWPTAPARSAPPPSLRHLKDLTGPFGLYEHARRSEPSPKHGYCTDDAGRALALACRLPEDPYAEELAWLTLRFLERAHAGGGHFLLRLGPGGSWDESPPSDDAAGRALLGLGTAASSAPWPALRQRAEALFVEAAGFTSPAPRAAAYGTLGATEVLLAPGAEGRLRRAARQLAERLAPLALPEAPAGGPWRWPEPQLSYANALLPHAALAAGAALEDDGALRAGLLLLEWLVQEECFEGRFSFAPVGGRGPGGEKPAFDQQPIEAAAMAHAAARAHALTGEGRWEAPIWAAVGWFLGDNDTGTAVWDPATGGGFDGLKRHGVNHNQGAESTIAFVATMALARHQAASSAASSSETDAVAAPT